MTEQTKRRQGQMKPNGREAVPKPLCPVCDVYLKRIYARGHKNGSAQFIVAGWMCPSATCDYIVKDYVELEDTEKRD